MKPCWDVLQLVIIAVVSHQKAILFSEKKKNSHKIQASQSRVLCLQGTNKRDVPTDKPLPNFNIVSRLDLSSCELKLISVGAFLERECAMLMQINSHGD